MALWEERARLTGDAVAHRYRGTLWGIPGTHLGRVDDRPTLRGQLTGHWQYWWQAHYLDALVDAAEREGGAAGARFYREGGRLLSTMRLRNFLRFPNLYFDDMAWLALATQRLARHAPSSLTGKVQDTLAAELRSGWSAEFGGGIRWRKRDERWRRDNFKNVPANGPAALYFLRRSARDGDDDATFGSALVDWVDETLLAPETGLYLDGIGGDPANPRFERTPYTYNQGTMLAAHLERGTPASLIRASRIIKAVERHLTAPARGPADGLQPLTTHGEWDGGLFTGILGRHLAGAALHPGLPPHSRMLAKELVEQTAEALWIGRAEAAAVPGLRAPLVFSADPTTTAGAYYRPEMPVHLSTQLQAWKLFEAAALLERSFSL